MVLNSAGPWLAAKRMPFVSTHWGAWVFLVAAAGLTNIAVDTRP